MPCFCILKTFLLSSVIVSWTKGGKVSHRTFGINCLPLCGLDWAWNWQHICPLSPRTCSPQVSSLRWCWLRLEVTATLSHACNWKSSQSSPKLKATCSTRWINKWCGGGFSVAVSCPTVCDPMGCSTPGSSVLHLSQSLLKLMSIESMMPSNHLIFCCPQFLLPSVFPSIRVFSSESGLCIRGPSIWSFSISPSNGYSGLVSFQIDWFAPLAVQGTLKSLNQQHSSRQWNVFQ